MSLKTNKCQLHNNKDLDIICIDKECQKRGLICNLCRTQFHLKHSQNCISLQEFISTIQNEQKKFGISSQFQDIKFEHESLRRKTKEIVLNSFETIKIIMEELMNYLDSIGESFCSQFKCLTLETNELIEKIINSGLNSQGVGQIIEKFLNLIEFNLEENESESFSYSIKFLQFDKGIEVAKQRTQKLKMETDKTIENLTMFVGQFQTCIKPKEILTLQSIVSQYNTESHQKNSSSNETNYQILREIENHDFHQFRKDKNMPIPSIFNNRDRFEQQEKQAILQKKSFVENDPDLDNLNAKFESSNNFHNNIKQNYEICRREIKKIIDPIANLNISEIRNQNKYDDDQVSFQEQDHDFSNLPLNSQYLFNQTMNEKPDIYCGEKGQQQVTQSQEGLCGAAFKKGGQQISGNYLNNQLLVISQVEQLETPQDENFLNNQNLQIKIIIQKPLSEWIGYLTQFISSLQFIKLLWLDLSKCEAEDESLFQLSQIWPKPIITSLTINLDLQQIQII